MADSEASTSGSSSSGGAAGPLDRLKLGFKGFKASFAAAPATAPAADVEAQPVGAMDGSSGSTGSGGNMFASWAEKAKKIVAEKVAYDPVPKDDNNAAHEAEGVDAEKGEGQSQAWANWAKAAANRVGKQVAGAAEEARQNLEKAAEKAKTTDLTQQVQGWQSEVAKGFGGAADRATQAREMFAERGKAASQLAKDIGGKAANKANEAKDKAAQKAREAKEKAAGVAGAAKDKLNQAGEGLKGLGSLALSPAKLAQFGGVFFVGVFLISMSFSFLPMLVIAPQKFALLFAFGSVTMLSSFAILKGPQAFASGLVRKEQLPFSAAYGVGLVGTLVATIIMRSFLLTAFFGLLQAVGLLYFVASYVPGGKACVNFIGRLCNKVAQKLLCRR